MKEMHVYLQCMCERGFRPSASVHKPDGRRFPAALCCDPVQAAFGFAVNAAFGDARPSINTNMVHTQFCLYRNGPKAKRLAGRPSAVGTVLWRKWKGVNPEWQEGMHASQM